MILFVNACVRGESRTRRLAACYLAGKKEPAVEERLEDRDFPKADGAFLLRRDRLIEEGQWDDPLFAPARRFAAADEILIAAPYWDLSFPAALKQYIEQINVVGITFRYTPEGIPQGLCRAKRLTFVTTAGGTGAPFGYGFGYIRALAEGFWGIPEVRLIKAEGLDLEGADPELILRAAEEEIRKGDEDRGEH